MKLDADLDPDLKHCICPTLCIVLCKCMEKRADLAFSKNIHLFFKEETFAYEIIACLFCNIYCACDDSLPLPTISAKTTQDSLPLPNPLNQGLWALPEHTHVIHPSS